MTTYRRTGNGTNPTAGIYAEFKMEAVKLVTEQGLSMAEAARRLDIASTSLHGWMRQAQAGKLKPR